MKSTRSANWYNLVPTWTWTRTWTWTCPWPRMRVCAALRPCATSTAVSCRIGENLSAASPRKCLQGRSQYRKRRTAGVSAEGCGVFKGEGDRKVSHRGRAVSKHCRTGRSEGYWPQHCCPEQRANVSESRKALDTGTSASRRGLFHGSRAGIMSTRHWFEREDEYEHHLEPNVRSLWYR